MKKLSENTYSHKGYKIIRTETTTDVVLTGHGCLYKAIRHVYRIENLKSEGMRPFLTSLAEVKQYIDERLSME